MTSREIRMDPRDRAWADVSLDAIAHNFESIQSYIRPGCQIIAVLKANAYGHGAPAVGRHLEKIGCRLFAVATFDEAAELRAEGIVSPILSLCPIPEHLTIEAARMNVLHPIPSLSHAEAVARLGKANGMAIPGYLMLDCGLSRFGIRMQCQKEALQQVQRIASMPELRLHSVMTHPSAGGVQEQHALNIEQLSLFESFCASMEASGIRLPKHCCASRLAVRYPDYQFDFVRIGSALFGVHPAYDRGPCFTPALQLRARIMQIKEVPAGAYVGYGPLYMTTQDTRIAVVPIGYVDGLSTRLGNRMHMLLHGTRVRQIGRLCMDCCMIDVTNVPAAVGDVVTVFGESEGALLSVQEHAALYDGTASELICLLGRRIPRIYF